MGRIVDFLKRVREYEEMEYPKVGQPFDTIGTEPPIGNKPPVTSRRVQPHIIDTESTGHFLNYWVETPERALEITIQRVAEIKKNKKTLGRI